MRYAVFRLASMLLSRRTGDIYFLSPRPHHVISGCFSMDKASNPGLLSGSFTGDSYIIIRL